MEDRIFSAILGYTIGIIFIAFYTIFPILIGSFYLWFILKMFHNKNISFFKTFSVSLISYISIVVFGFLITLTYSIFTIPYKNFSQSGFFLYTASLLSLCSLSSIVFGTVLIRKLFKESFSYSLLISILVLLLTIATFVLVLWYPTGGFFQMSDS